MTRTTWDLLRADDYDQAIRCLEEQHTKRGTSSQIMELGVAYLWVRDYQAALTHFSSANLKYPKHADIFYAMAGVAQWCLNDPHRSVHHWCAGLDAQFVDPAGGVTIPLLLFFASIVKPEVFDRCEAEELLAIRAKDRRSCNWPGALVAFLLGRIDLDALRDECIGRDASDTMLRHWLADYYVGVLDYASGNTVCFKELMCKTGVTSNDDFDVAKGHYLGKLWRPEFFIARHVSTG